MEAIFFDLDTARHILPTEAFDDIHLVLNSLGEVTDATKERGSLVGKSFFELYRVNDSEREAMMRFLALGNAPAMLLQGEETPFLVLRTLFGMMGGFLVLIPPPAHRAMLSGPAWMPHILDGTVALSPASAAAGACLDGDYRAAVSWLNAYRPLLSRDFQLTSEDELLTMAVTALAAKLAGAFGVPLTYVLPDACAIRAKTLDAPFLRAALTALCLTARAASREVRLGFGMEGMGCVLYAEVKAIADRAAPTVEAAWRIAADRGIQARCYFEDTTLYFVAALTRSEISDQQLRTRPVWQRGV